MIPLLFLAAALALQPQPASHASSTASVQTSPSREAMKLARVLYGEEAQGAAAERLFESEVAPTLRANPDMKAIEKDYPGFTAAILSEMKPVMARSARESALNYHERVAALFDSRFTPVELEDLTKFYQSPTGQKMVAGMAENMSMQAILSEMSKDPDKPTSYSAVVADHRAASEKVKALIGKEDEAALMELVKKPHFVKLAAIGPAMRKLDQDFFNEPDPKLEAEIEAIFEATLAKFEAAKP